MQTIKSHIQHLIQFLQHLRIIHLFLQEVHQWCGRQSIVQVLKQLSTWVDILLVLVVYQVHLGVILT